MDWNTVLITLVTAMISAITGILITTSGGMKQLIEVYFKKKSRQILKDVHAGGLQSLGEYMYVLDKLMRFSYVDRVIIFSGQNGGGKPQVGKPYTIRALYGYSKNGDDVYKRYDFDIPIDKDYYFMIADLIQKESIVNIVSEMKDGSILKAYYTQEKVMSSVLYLLHIYEDDNAIHYINIGSYTQVFTREQLIPIELEIARLRGLHNKD